MVKERGRVLRGNELFFEEVEKPRTHTVSLADLTKQEAMEQNLHEVWKEYRALTLEIEKAVLDLEEDDTTAPEIPPPVLDPEEEKKILMKSRPRGGAIKGSIPAGN